MTLIFFQSSSQLSEEAQEEYQEAFRLYDKGGNTPAKTLGFVLRYLGQNPSDQELINICNKYGQGNKINYFHSIITTLLFTYTQNKFTATNNLLNASSSKKGGAINQQGFLSFMSSKTRDVESEDNIVEAFQVFDKDGKGYISAAELRNILTNMGDRLNEDQVNQMLREALASEDGNLDYRQFVHMMMNR